MVLRCAFFTIGHINNISMLMSNVRMSKNCTFILILLCFHDHSPRSLNREAEWSLMLECPADAVPLLNGRLCCCTFSWRLFQIRFRSVVWLLTGSVSTWKWYKSTVVQEAFAISSSLRHKRITVPLTQTTTTWDPAQRWNFPTDKNTQTVRQQKPPL